VAGFPRLWNLLFGLAAGRKRAKGFENRSGEFATTSHNFELLVNFRLMMLVLLPDADNGDNFEILEDPIDHAIISVMEAAEVFERACQRLGASDGITVNLPLKFSLERVPDVLGEFSSVIERFRCEL
jgi:hypothetical protein